MFVEVRDARAPLLTHNPDIYGLFAEKVSVTVLNKADLADKAVTRRWCAVLGKRNQAVMSVNSISTKPRKLIDKLQSFARSDRCPCRVAVVGVSNVGKSSLINRIIGRKTARVEARPGVTRAVSWLRAGKCIELLDSPGLVPHRIPEGDEWAMMVALGVVPPDPGEMDEIACCIIRRLGTEWVARAYGAEQRPLSPSDFLYYLAEFWSMKVRGGDGDCKRAANRLVHDFIRGKLPPVSIEVPEI